MTAEREEFNYVITEEGEGERIDKYLNLLMGSLSRSYIQKLLSKEMVE